MKAISWKGLLGIASIIGIFIIGLSIFLQKTGNQTENVTNKKSFSIELDDIIKEEHFQGNVLLIKNDTLFFEKSYGFANKSKNISNDATTIFPIASLQKIITGAIILQLVQEKKLDLTTPLVNFYPEIPTSETITINDLLNHTSGIVMSETEPETILETEKSQIQNTLNELEVIPDAQFIYTNANYTLLAGIISQITGQSYEEVVSNRIVAPLGLEHTYFWNQLPKNDSIPVSYIYDGNDYQTDSFPSTTALFSSLLGAGNLYMSIDDFWVFIQSLSNSQLFAAGEYQKLVGAKEGGYRSGISYFDDLQYSEGLLGGYDLLFFGDQTNNQLILLFGNQAPINGMDSLGEKVYQLLENT